MDIVKWLRTVKEDNPFGFEKVQDFKYNYDGVGEPEAPATADSEEGEAPVPTIEAEAEAVEEKELWDPEPPRPSKASDSWPSTPTSESEIELSTARGSTPPVRSEEEEEEEEEEDDSSSSSSSTQFTCLLIGDNLPPAPTARTHSTTLSEQWERDKDRYIVSTGASRGIPGLHNDITLRAEQVDEALRYDPWLPVLTVHLKDRAQSPSSSYRPESPLSQGATEPPTPPRKPKPAPGDPPKTPGDPPTKATKRKRDPGDPGDPPKKSKKAAPALRPILGDRPGPDTSDIAKPKRKPDPPAAAESERSATPTPPPSPRPRLYPLPSPTVEAQHLAALSRFGNARPSFFLLETVDPTGAMPKACRLAGCTVPFNKLLNYLDASVEARRDMYLALMKAHAALREHEELWRGMEKWITLTEAPPPLMSIRRRLKRRDFVVFKERAEEMVWLKWKVRDLRKKERAARRRSAKYRREAMDVRNRWYQAEAMLQAVGVGAGAEEGGMKGLRREFEEREKEVVRREREKREQELEVAWEAAGKYSGEVDAEKAKVAEAAEAAAEAVAAVEGLLAEKAAVEGELEEKKTMVAKLEKKVEDVVEKAQELVRKQLLEVLDPKNSNVPGALEQALDLSMAAVPWATLTTELPELTPPSPDRDSEGRDVVNLEEEEEEEEEEPGSPTPFPISPSRTKASILKELSAAEWKIIGLQAENERLEELINALKDSNVEHSRQSLEELKRMKGKDVQRRSITSNAGSHITTSPATGTPSMPAPSPLLLMDRKQPTPEQTKRRSIADSVKDLISGKRNPPPPPIMTSRPTTSMSQGEAFSASTVRDADAPESATMETLARALRQQEVLEEVLEREKEKYGKLENDKNHLSSAMDALKKDIQGKEDRLKKMEDILKKMAQDNTWVKLKADQDRAELRAKHEKEVAELRNKSENAEAELRLKHETQMEEKKKKHKAKKEEMKKDHKAEKEALTADFAKKEEALAADLAKEKEEFARRKAEEMAEHEARLTARVADAETRMRETEAFRMAQQTHWETVIMDLEAKHAQTIARLEAEHAQAAERLRAEHEQAIKTLTAEHEQAMETLTTMHDQEIETLTAQGKKDMEALEAQGKKDMEALEERHKAEADALLAVGEKERQELAKSYEYKLRTSSLAANQGKVKLREKLNEFDKLQAENKKLLADYEAYRDAHPPPVTPSQVQALKDLMLQAIRDGKTDPTELLMDSAKKIIPMPVDALLEDLIKRHDQEEEQIQALDRERAKVRDEAERLDEEHAALVALQEDFNLATEEARNEYRQRSEELDARMTQWEADYQRRSTELNNIRAGLNEEFRQRYKAADARIAEYEAKIVQYDKDLEKLQRDRDQVISDQERLHFEHGWNDDEKKKMEDEKEALYREALRLNELESEYMAAKEEAEELKEQLEDEQHRLEQRYQEAMAEVEELEASLRDREDMIKADQARVADEAARLKEALAAFDFRRERVERRRIKMKLLLESMVKRNIERQEILVSNQLLDLHVRQQMERLGHEICFCSLLQFYFPRVYDATINGGCCGMREEHPAMDWPRVSIAERKAEAERKADKAAAGVTSVCHGHHGHGHISAAGASWTFICQVLTASVWFVCLLILQTHNLQRLLWFNLSIVAGLPLFLGQLALFGITMAWMALRLPFQPASKPAFPKPWFWQQRPSPAALVGVVVTTVTVLTFLSAEAVRQERLIWLQANSWRGYLAGVQHTAPYWALWPMEVDFRLAYEPMFAWLFDGVRELLFPPKRGLVEGEGTALAAVVRWFFD